MKKRILALLLACCLILVAAPICVGAATGETVSASAATVTAGNSATVTLKAENFAGIATAEVYVYYDAAALTLSSTANGSLLSGAQVSVNTSQAGQVKLVAMSLDGISGTGNLLTLYFKTASTCKPGTYPITVAMGGAYDTALAPVTIGTVSGSVTVNAPSVNAEHFTIYNYLNKSTLKKGEVLTYQVASASSSRSFASAEFIVEYDYELFAFDSVALESALAKEGAVYSVNSSTLGQVRIVYASVDPVATFYLFKVNLKVIADTNTTTTVRAEATNVYKEDLSAYTPGTASSTITLERLPVVVDHPDAYLTTDTLIVGTQSNATFFLEEGAGIAAADFTITYDPTLLRCVSVSAAEGIADVGGMVVINDHFSDGAIRFSYVNMSAYSAQNLPIVNIVWEPLDSSETHSGIEISGVGVVDAKQNPITLEYCSAASCIYRAIVVEEATCQKEGSMAYLCACGATLPTQVIPKLEEAECTHYTVSFVNDGSELSSNAYHYGEEVVIPADPTKESDETYTYTFAGWDKEIVACNGNATYTATYTPVYIDYTVVFENWDGSVISTKTYHYGDKVTAPADPTKAADETYTYAFSGWDKDVVDCAGDVTYKATFEASYINYTVVFQNEDGSVISTKTYHYGDKVIAPADPAKAADETYTYAFAGWDKEIVTCNGNATYTATYTPVYIDYTVIFQNWDGSVISTKSYHYGDKVIAPADPTKDADNTYTYAFSGWDKEVVDCAGDVTYKATFEATYIDYTVIFLDEDGTELSKKIYHYGDKVIAPINPARPADNTYTYTFAGWDKEIVTCTGNATYSATYTPVYIDYTVIFQNWDGSVISTKSYHYGDKVIAPANPTKAADNTYTYAFNGWDKEVVDCAGDVTYKATFEASYINYTVVFQNEDGSVISTKTYHYGDKVTAPADPAKAADETYTYAFAGWNATVVNCVGDATYIATYTPVYIDYTVVFENWDGSVVSAKTYHYGDKVTAPADPTKAADETYTYAFSGWDKEVVDCAGDVTYKATYTATYIDYTVIFLDEDGTELSKKIYHYGDKVIAPINPARPADNTYTYTFAGWDKEIVACTGNATYSAMYTPAYIDYTVVFQYADGTVIQAQTYHYGDQVVAPQRPAVPDGLGSDFVFGGWSPSVSVCTGNAVYTATFTDQPIPGDLDADGEATVKDVELLLMYTLYPEAFPLPEGITGDFNGNGSTEATDVEYLLMHTLYPEFYPITAAAPAQMLAIPPKSKETL